AAGGDHGDRVTALGEDAGHESHECADASAELRRVLVGNKDDAQRWGRAGEGIRVHAERSGRWAAAWDSRRPATDARTSKLGLFSERRPRQAPATRSAKSRTPHPVGPLMKGPESLSTACTPAISMWAQGIEPSTK